MQSPLDQFIIKPLASISMLGVDLSFTNSAFALIVTTFLLISLIIFSTNKRAVIPGALQSLVESVYIQIDKVLEGAVGPGGRKYIPMVFSIFLFVAGCNMVGMLPMAFASTSHIAVTLSLAGSVFIVINIIGFSKHGLRYFSVFLPSGTPLLLAPLMICIELFAYLARPFSLSIRLAANVIAGHVVMKIFAALTLVSGIYGVFPFALLTIMTGFEIFMSLLQAYIFTVLTCSYLNDAVNLH